MPYLILPHTEELCFEKGVEDVRESKPRFKNYERVLEKYWKKLEPELWSYLEGNLGEEKASEIYSFLQNVEVEVKKLPTIYAVENGIEKPAAKISGMYNSDTKQLYLDPSIFDEIEGGEKEDLERYGLRGKVKDIFIHEITHAMQDRVGALYDMPRWYIEGAATKITEDITGNRQKIYPQEKKEVEKVAEKYSLSPEEILKGAKKLPLKNAA